MNHFMLNKIGIPSYYGQAFIPDICELLKEMLPYTKLYFEELLNKQMIQNVQPSSEWYEERLDYSKKSLGVALKNISIMVLSYLEVLQNLKVKYWEDV